MAIGRRTDDQFPGYKVQLWAGETLLAEDDNTLTPAPGTFATSRIVANIGATHPALGENLEIVLISQGRQINFDDVRLTTKPFAPPISNIRFHVKLDGNVEKVIVRNGALGIDLQIAFGGVIVAPQKRVGHWKSLAYFLLVSKMNQNICPTAIKHAVESSARERRSTGKPKRRKNDPVFFAPVGPRP